MNDTISLLDTIIEQQPKPKKIKRQEPQKKTLNRIDSPLLFKTERTVSFIDYFNLRNIKITSETNNSLKLSGDIDLDFKIFVFAKKLGKMGFIIDNLALDYAKTKFERILNILENISYEIVNKDMYYQISLNTLMKMIIINTHHDMIQYDENYENIVGVGVEMFDEKVYYKVNTLKKQNYCNSNVIKDNLNLVSNKTKRVKAAKTTL